MYTVNVVMGGPSAEHEISLRTGREILLHIDKSKYSVRAVVVTHNRQFYCTGIRHTIPALTEFADPAHSAQFTGPLHPSSSLEIWHDCDVALLALHGAFGEDGVFQGFLETLGIPYTGSGVFASAVGMNKIACKHLFIQRGLDTPPFSVYGKHFPETTIETIVQNHGFPCFVKCPQSGSSRLMGKAENEEQLAAMLAELSKESAEILIETTIVGEEYSCPVIERKDGSLQALPPILIRPVKSAFFDYEAKYTTGASEEIVPAPISASLTRRIQDVALRAHQTIDCRGISRTDIILRDNRLFVLEINTLPGLTSNSLAPKAFAAINGTYAQLLDTLIETAFNKGIKALA
jgi:D-alanine-D-alanine ligase